MDPNFTKFWSNLIQIGSNCVPLDPTGPSWARSGVWPVRSQNCENFVISKVIIRCKNKALGSVWQKHEKKSSKSMCFSDESLFCCVLACTGAPRFLPTPQPAHRTKGSSDLASSEVTRIAARSAFWEHAAGAAEAGEVTEVLAGPAARTPIPHAPGVRMT